MNEFDEKEYNSVVLGALLHDVGKFLQRAKGQDAAKGGHEDISGDFISGKNEFAEGGNFENLKFSPILIKLKEKNQIDIELVENTARYHSSPHTPRNENMLELIVNQADSYSSNERRTIKEKQGVGGSKFTPLFSVFHKMKLDKTIDAGCFSYNAIPTDSIRAFPEKGKNKLEDSEVSKLIGEFTKEINSIDINSVCSSFNNLYNTLLSIWEKYLCFLPCDTSLDYPDVSLFDHMKSTSAIAATLFQYHFHTKTLENIAQNKEHVIDKATRKFLLVGGELSGIQNYIYEISSITGEGGAAKRLRARSFYISVLVEIIILKILKTLVLPLSCNLMCSGGKFIIIAPNTNDSLEKLRTVYENISDWMIEEYSGEVALNMVWDTEICGNDFHMRDESVVKEGEEYADSNFYDCIKRLESSLLRKKKNKFNEFLLSSTWNEYLFVRAEKYEEYETGKKACRSCGKFPVKFPDPHEEMHEKSNEEKFCEKCAIDKVIGRRLLDAKYIAIGIDTDGKYDRENAKKLIDRESFFFFEDKYFIHVLKDYKFESDYLLIEKIRDRETEKEQIKPGTVYKFIGNHAPVFDNTSKRDETCDKCKQDKIKCDHYIYMHEKKGNKHLYTFECIAAESSDYEIISGKKLLLGNQMIGYLKADVDNLGLLMSEGLRERLTISRYLTVSRMVDLFFSGWLYRTLRENQKFRNIYTVYSGGDNLVLVGPWESIIKFSRHLHYEFSRFTCNNKNITLSAGIIISKPKQAVSLSLEKADGQLEMSKDVDDKDSLTVWNTTLNWKDFDGLESYMNTLRKGYLLFPDILSRQFIYRLLKYQNMFLSYDDVSNRKIEGLMFHSKMSYDVRRNITERLKHINFLEKIFLLNKRSFILTELENNTPNIGGFVNKLKKLALEGLISYSYDRGRLRDDSRIKITIKEKGKKNLNRKEIETRKWFNENIPKELLRLYMATTDKDTYDQNLMRSLKIPVFWTLYKTRNQ